MRDVLEAEYTFFGEGNRHLTVRKSPGGADRLNDLAQAWIEGRHEEVLAYARAHSQKIRTRIASVNIGGEDRDIDLIRKVAELREKRWTTEEIAKHLHVAKSRVQAICRGLTPLPRRSRRRKANVAEIHRLRAEGLTWMAIAEQLSLSWRHVARILSTRSPDDLPKPPSRAASLESATT